RSIHTAGVCVWSRSVAKGSSAFRISNTEVKTSRADDTWGASPWKSRLSPGKTNEKAISLGDSLFACFHCGSVLGPTLQEYVLRDAVWRKARPLFVFDPHCWSMRLELQCGEGFPFVTKSSFGVGGSAILIPLPRSISYGISGFGETLHWRLSSLETIVIIVFRENDCLVEVSLIAIVTTGQSNHLLQEYLNNCGY
ncbi:MAG TPA: hypothetical protein VN456_07725, partial [Desulfosporosinus sp.]|nr:hypothetical protein [Desulfosporosinus sp.]